MSASIYPYRVEEHFRYETMGQHYLSLYLS